MSIDRQHANFSMRESGLLVPFRSLPGEHDHQGTLGTEAVEFLELMNRAGFNVLHDLPNTPPDPFNCPYSSVSAFALDVQRIDLIQVARSGDISLSDISHYQNKVASGDAGPAIANQKTDLLKQAFINFDNSGSHERRQAFEQWRQSEASWLDSYAAYEILKDLPPNQAKRWQDWEVGKDFSPQLVAQLRQRHEQDFSAICYAQWVADEQTKRYLQAAERLGVEVWGDVPFYVGDGEVWANRQIFNLDEHGNKLSQGGAAPSATSSTGQIWGNATYKIDPIDNPVETAQAIDWWSQRLIRASKLSSGKVRLDHFIGFAEPYIIAVDAADGSTGQREAGMGRELFLKLRQTYGHNLPFYPEDLGTMTEKTPQLRDEFGFLSTTLAVRALTKDLLANNYAQSQNNPDNYHPNVVSFSGNHDSPTLIQAMDGIRSEKPEAFANYLSHLNQQFPHANIDTKTPTAELAQLEMERVVRSVGKYAFIGIWDALQLGPEGRYNIPGTILASNWSWRMDSTHVSALKKQAPTWRELNESSGRTLRQAS